MCLRSIKMLTNKRAVINSMASNRGNTFSNKNDFKAFMVMVFILRHRQGLYRLTHLKIYRKRKPRSQIRGLLVASDFTTGLNE